MILISFLPAYKGMMIQRTLTLNAQRTLYSYTSTNIIDSCTTYLVSLLYYLLVRQFKKASANKLIKINLILPCSS